MPEIATVVPGALDRFILDLVEAGFETRAGRVWDGPLDPSLVDLTEATSMRVFIDDGWPYRHPHVYVGGLRPSVHLNGTALCLWRVGDDSLAWLRLDDLRERIAQWADRYRGHATLDDPILDPDRYFMPRNDKVLAAVDLSQFRWGNGGSGGTTAELKDELMRIGEKGDLRVRWYGRDGMRHPPVNVGMVKEGLSAQQARNLERELQRVGRPGGMDVLMLIWDTPPGEPAILALRLARQDDEVVAEAIEVARTDEEVLLRRAGPDAPALRDKRVVVFGQGAIGSHVSNLLARSGVGALTGVDGERLRPGDLVRHAGLTFSVGSSKVDAVNLVNFMVAPWTKPVSEKTAIWDPTRLRALAAAADLVIDAVGEGSFTDQLSRACVEVDVPVLAVALYRGGSVARVRVHSPGGIPIHERTDVDRFAPIPPGPLDETLIWESGCASPVSNAPPASVVSAAALAARLAVGLLTRREAMSFDAIDVYEPIEAPFDVVGHRRVDAP